MILTWQYVAGIFDGEGYVGVQSGGGALTAKISISQSGKQGEALFGHLYPWLRDKGIKVYLSGHVLADPRYQKKWTLETHTRASVTAFLEGVFPYLIVKKTTSQDVLRFFKLFPKLSSAPTKHGKDRWETRVKLYGPSGNKCGLYSKQIGKDRPLTSREISRRYREKKKILQLGATQ